MRLACASLAGMLCLWFVPLFLFAQHPADSSARYYRLICLVHLTGTGKKDDPIRPEYIPDAADAKREGIIAWSVQITDDKRMAIVHLVAVKRTAFASILKDERSENRVFEIGRHSREEIESEMKKYKKDFDLTRFEVRAN